MCDRDLVLTVRADGNLVIDGKRDNRACRSALVISAIELRFDRDVDPGNLHPLYLIGPTVSPY